MDETLHEADEPISFFDPERRLVSLLEIVGAGHAKCDLCGRWQRFAAVSEDSAREYLKRFGWGIYGEWEICPRCLVLPHLREAEMDIHSYPDELDWVNATRGHRPADDKSFLGTFCDACVRADGNNYELLRPVLAKLMEKYPADPHLLENERRDRV